MPPALFVIPASVPEPVIFIVPVFVKLATAVVVVPAAERLIIPALVRVVIAHEPAPAPLKLSVPVPLLVNPPVPDSAVAAVIVPLLVSIHNFLLLDILIGT